MSNHEVTTATISFIAGSSDKFYRSFVIGNVVTFQYGRNGTAGMFTPRKEFKDADAAQKAADKKLAGKIGEGYNPTAAGTLSFDHEPTDSELDQAANKLPVGGSGVSMPTLREQSAVVVATNETAAIDTEALARVTAKLESGPTDLGANRITRPMLAQIVDPADLNRLLDSPEWVMQPKLDGDRVVVEVIDGVVSVLNRSGQPKVKNIGEAHLAPFRSLTEGRWIFDGEIVGRTLHVFDMPAAGTFHDESANFTTRYRNLTVTLANLGVDVESIRLVHTTEGSAAKRELLATAKAAGKEGVMFRSVHSSYQPAVRSEYLLKSKFTREIDAVVTRVGVGNKENAELAVHNAAGELVVVGQVTTIGKGAITVGDVVEVTYLYITTPSAPRLYQPRIVRVRHDKPAADCSIDQLAHAVTDKTVD